MTRSRSAHKTSPIPEAWDLQHTLSGEETGIPMVTHLAASRSHQASRISWHEHPHYELVMLLEGASGWEFSQNTPVRLCGGEFKVVPPRTPHRGLQDVRSPSTLCIVGFRPEAAASGRTVWSLEDSEWLAARFARNTPTPRRMSAEMRKSALSLHRLILHPPRKSVSPDFFLHMRLLIHSVILEAARQENPPAPDGAVRAVEAACLFMQEEFFRPLQIDEVAGHVDCSRSQLYSAFKKQTGLSPNDWLLRYRIQQAESLLAATNRTIEDIASAVGFSSSPYFCTVFRKYTGSPPGAFRRRKKGAIEPAAE